MAVRSLYDLEVGGKRVLMRVDYNVPLDDAGGIEDDIRIRRTLPSIRHILHHGGSVVLMSHLGRPKGSVKPELSLVPVAKRLEELLGEPVTLLADCVGPEVEKAVAAMQPGEVCLLENLRFHKEEEANDPAFADALSGLGEVYVNDAFGACHRAHASVVGPPTRLPAAAGFLVEKEVEYLGAVLTGAERPFVALMGGKKVADKIKVVENLLGLVDRLLIGGAMTYTFMGAKGEAMGKSLVFEEDFDLARDLLRKGGDKLVLPTDHVVADGLGPDARTQEVTGEIPEGWIGVDIGPDSAAAYADLITGARTVVWNGPMGIFEVAAFSAGTRAVCDALAACAGRTVVGGGESAQAVETFGVADRVDHVSTGGGASLEFLEGTTLPGIAALEQQSTYSR